MQYVGYLIDHHGEGLPVAAGSDKRGVFTRTFARLGKDVFAFPEMAIRKCDITADEAAQLEAIAVEHLGGLSS